jgi:hypothetical protein
MHSRFASPEHRSACLVITINPRIALIVPITTRNRAPRFFIQPRSFFRERGMTAETGQGGKGGRRSNPAGGEAQVVGQPVLFIAPFFTGRDAGKAIVCIEQRCAITERCFEPAPVLLQEWRVPAAET